MAIREQALAPHYEGTPLKGNNDYGIHDAKELKRGKVGNPAQWIAGEIIKQAAVDWRKLGHMKKSRFSSSSNRSDAFNIANEAGFESPRDQLIDFFYGVWFEGLCEIVGPSICPRQIREHLGVPNAEPQRIDIQLGLFK